jgi:hypothetical protein
MTRAIASLIETFSPAGKVPEGMSVNVARTKALRYLKPDSKNPDKGRPGEDVYSGAIKHLGRAPRKR